MPMIPLRRMKLRVERITEEAQACDFAEAFDGINQRLDNGAHDFRLVAPLVAHLTYYRAAADLFFDGSLTIRAEGVCARCLETFSLALDVPCSFALTPAKQEAGKAELHPDDLTLSTYAGDEIDLAPLVEEQTILALPTRALCREDCRGLCATCGRNRNLDSCECRSGEPDPRLAVLRGLKLGSA